MQELRIFFTALGFFTRLPVPAWVGHDGAQLAAAPRYLPLVGILVGVMGAAVTEAAALALPISVSILLGMIATLWVTGAFHEDGFADACDGFGGGYDKAGVLAIMKDSRVGSYGAMGIALLLLLKYLALSEVDVGLDPVDDDAVEEVVSWLPIAIVAAHAVSRLAAVSLMAMLDYAREDESKSAPLARRLAIGPWLLAAVTGLAPCLFLPFGHALVALTLVLAATLLAARYFHRRLGGYTGDCLGATQQVTEVLFYLGLLCSFT